jgi:hypothetical protein
LPGPPFSDPKKQQEWEVVNGVIEVLRRRGHDLHCDEMPPDLPGARPARQGKLVDFVLVDHATGNARWNVEVKRLVPRHVRERDGFTRRRLACLKGRLPGTYATELPIDCAEPLSRVDDRALDVVIARIREDADRGAIADVYDFEPACIVRKVRLDGAAATPWLWDEEPEFRSPRYEAALKLLADDFGRQLGAARLKFAASPAARNLLILETRGSSLDPMIHMWWSAEGPGVMSAWMSAHSADWTDADLVIVDPHVWVGQFAGGAGSRRMRLVFTGTVYADDLPYTPLGSQWRLWTEPPGYP